jgi:hypothetical protein
MGGTLDAAPLYHSRSGCEPIPCTTKTLAANCAWDQETQAREALWVFEDIYVIKPGGPECRAGVVVVTSSVDSGWGAMDQVWLGPTIASFGAIITFFQWRIARNKLKLDLLDRRLAVYRSIKACYAEVEQGYLKGQLIYPHIDEFNDLVEQTKILFDDKMTCLLIYFYNDIRYLGARIGSETDPRAKIVTEAWAFVRESRKEVELRALSFLRVNHNVFAWNPLYVKIRPPIDARLAQVALNEKRQSSTAPDSK